MFIVFVFMIEEERFESVYLVVVKYYVNIFYSGVI